MEIDQSGHGGSKVDDFKHSTFLQEIQVFQPLGFYNETEAKILLRF